MPQVNVVRDELFKFIGKSFTDEEFEDLCFEFGLEVEFGMGDPNDMNMVRVDGAGNNVDMSQTYVYKIEVPANRYDLLCLEGISQAFRAYLGIEKLPAYSLSQPAKMEKIIVKPETFEVRPFVVSCILRNITFDVQSYNSFIDLQDKLHNNICRKRTLGSMGTHDLDKVQFPVTYEAHPPTEINFQALKQTKSMNAQELFGVFKDDIKMKQYLPILAGKPKYPVFYDAKRTVLSLPPIINSEATKITMDTKNVLIEITGTDLKKVKINLAILACQFSHHCSGNSKFKVEPVEVVYEGGKVPTQVEPNLTPSEFECEVSYITRQLGIQLTAEQMNAAGEKMGLVALPTGAGKVKFAAAAIRADILHACDISEEVGIGYGFNKIPMQPLPTNTTGGFIPQNKFTDLMRHEVAQAGFIESLTFALVSIKENYLNLRYPLNESEAVQLSNPKTKEFEVVRTSLIPGLLKTLQCNQNEKLPQKLFEISDTSVIDKATDTGAKNVRRICVMQLNTQDNFEVIHGALGMLMTKVGAKENDFTLVEDVNDRKFFPGRGAKVMLGKQPIGCIGVLHPEVLANFELKNPVSVMELDLEPIWQFYKSQ